jgi:hypothetical protein
VKGYRLVRGLGRLDAAAPDEVGDDHRVVQHLEVAVELGILVLDGVEAVGAVRDDLVERVFLDVLHVLRGHRLVEIFLAQTAGDLAVAALFGHDGERHARLLEDLHHRAGDVLIAPVVGGGAADPVEILDALAFHEHGNVEPLRPLEPLGGRKAPRVARALDVLQRQGRRGG